MKSKAFELRIEQPVIYAGKEQLKITLVTITTGNPATICTIQQDVTPLYSLGSDWPLKAFGTGICKHGDAYDFETGCRMALRSALRKIDDRELRGMIWAKYLEMFPVKDRVPPMKASEPLIMLRAMARIFRMAELR